MVNVLVKTKDGETLFNMDRGGRVDLEKWAGGWRVGSEHPTGTGYGKLFPTPYDFEAGE